jgi:hypothetical protein
MPGRGKKLRPIIALPKPGENALTGVKDAAKFLGVHRNRIYQYMQRKTDPLIPVQGFTPFIFKLSDLVEFKKMQVGRPNGPKKSKVLGEISLHSSPLVEALELMLAEADEQ